MKPIAIGRLLRSNTTGCVVGCKVSQLDSPSFGDMLRIPLDDDTQVYGLVHDIHIDDDGLVRQLVTAPEVSDEIIEDNRQNRNMPIEMSMVFIGWERGGVISHTRVPRPPLTLDAIFRCSDQELAEFTRGGQFGYLRALLRDPELPAADLIAAHIRQVAAIQPGGTAPDWTERLIGEVITQLKDDYPRLMDTLGSVSEIL